MPDTKTIQRVQQERHSANHDKLYQATKKEVDDHELKATAQENKKLLRQSTKLGLDMAIELIDLRNKLKENNSVRDNGLGLSKETKDKMVEYVKTNSKATLLDLIKKFYSR